MKFIVQVEIISFIVHFQLAKSQSYTSNGTIYVNHGNETTTEQQQQPQPKYVYQNDDNKNIQEEPKEGQAAEPVDHYTFVALIEIMFSDGSRKNCTGAIIHDNVVITAAHCFEKDHLDSPQLELTGSFVIIGTKQMFDTGYEQYLPIERVLIHPDYLGWKADIALVYTFAGMMSDKPGNIIPFAEGNTFTSLYSNVTVLNWNQINKKTPVKSTILDSDSRSFLDSGCSQSSEEKDTYFHKGVTRPIYSKIEDWSREDTKSPTSKTDTYESRLLMEDYTILEIRSCKQLVHRYKPAIYQIDNVHSTLCYYTKNSNKVQANSGAPAIYRNYLIAIATGDFNNDNDHIIVATKLSCYCTWISENLPTGGDQIQCCTDCCSEKYFKRNKKMYNYDQMTEMAYGLWFYNGGFCVVVPKLSYENAGYCPREPYCGMP